MGRSCVEQLDFQHHWSAAGKPDGEGVDWGEGVNWDFWQGLRVRVLLTSRAGDDGDIRQCGFGLWVNMLRMGSSTTLLPALVIASGTVRRGVVPLQASHAAIGGHDNAPSL